MGVGIFQNVEKDGFKVRLNRKRRRVGLGGPCTRLQEESLG